MLLVHRKPALVTKQHTLLCWCTGCDWNRVNFLHSSSYDAMFWICEQNSLDDTLILQLLLSSTCTASRPFLLLKLPCQRIVWGRTRSRCGTQLGQLAPA